MKSNQKKYSQDTSITLTCSSLVLRSTMNINSLRTFKYFFNIIKPELYVPVLNMSSKRMLRVNLYA